MAMASMSMLCQMSAVDVQAKANRVPRSHFGVARSGSFCLESLSHSPRILKACPSSDLTAQRTAGRWNASRFTCCRCSNRRENEGLRCCMVKVLGLSVRAPLKLLDIACLGSVWFGFGIIRGQMLQMSPKMWHEGPGIGKPARVKECDSFEGFGLC